MRIILFGEKVRIHNVIHVWSWIKCWICRTACWSLVSSTVFRTSLLVSGDKKTMGLGSECINCFFFNLCFWFERECLVGGEICKVEKLKDNNEVDDETTRSRRRKS